MALVRCSECGKEISSKAEKCPNCGYITKQEKVKRTFKPLIIIIIVFLLIMGIYLVFVKNNSISSFFQFGSAEAQNDIKETQQGSLSNPYKTGDIVELTIYDVQGYNYATGIRTVANPAKIRITVEAPLFETVQDIFFLDGTVENEHFYGVGLAIECLSTTGDLANLFSYSMQESFLTKDRQQVGRVIEAADVNKWASDNEMIQKYVRQSYYNSDIYEGKTTRILIGGFGSKMNINSIDELDLLKISYYDEDGDYNTIYISLNE